MASTKNGEFNDDENDITRAETPIAILKRLITHMCDVAVSLDTAVPLLETIEGSDREHLVRELADEADKLRDVAAELGPALRTLHLRPGSNWRNKFRRRILDIVGPLSPDDDNDDAITQTENPNAILKRIVAHLRGVAVSLDTAIPLLETIDGSDREYLIGALADEADELRDAAADLGPALRALYRG